MKFNVVIGNPPYQRAKTSDKKGKSGNNSLYIEFIEKAIELSNVVAFVTPPAALVKSTNLNEKTKTLSKMQTLKFINLDARQYFNVGSQISWWIWDKEYTGKTKVISNNVEFEMSDVSYLPPLIDELELSIYNKIVQNKNGDQIKVFRERGDEKNDYWFARFGHSYIEKGRNPDRSHALSTTNEWITTDVAAFYIDYISRHDAMTYHNMINGLYDGEIEFTKEERQHIKNIAKKKK